MATAYAQTNRPLRVTTPLGANVLLARALQGTESLSELFCFRLELSADKYVKIPFEQLLGQSVTIEIAHPTGATRTVNGIVNRFSQGERDDVFASYEAEVVPRIWLLTKRFNSRIFQQLSVPEILAKVLTGFKYSPELSGTYQPRDYCVQYQESDFAFISRLMEEEGISYFFRHQTDSHELVLTDTSTNLAAVAAPSNAIYEQVRGAVKDTMRITAWKKSQQICSNRYTLWDHSFELPGKNLEAGENVPATLQVGKVTHNLPGIDQKLEAYCYPGEFAKRFDGIEPGGGDRAADLANIFTSNKRTANVRMQAGLSDAITISGAGNCVNFIPGSKFTLERHFDADGSYLLTRVEHVVKLPGTYRSGNDNDTIEYENRFTCIPAEVPFRPQRSTSRPQIAGMQTATVVGPAGEQIFCDKYGRIKVQFHWDREGQNDSNSSCWIRVGQIWAGKRWGASFVPRVGHEVVVVFEDADPDQPLVIGSVYNAANMPPFVLPDQKLVAGIKSCSVNGEPSKNFNGIIFHDELGNEHVQVHSERSEIHNCESGRRERTYGTHVQVAGSLLGSLGMSGSGSGGGGFLDRLAARPQAAATKPDFRTLSVAVHGDLSAALSLSKNRFKPATFSELRKLVVDPYEVLAGLAGRLDRRLSGDSVVGPQWPERCDLQSLRARRSDLFDDAAMRDALIAAGTNLNRSIELPETLAGLSFSRSGWDRLFDRLLGLLAASNQILARAPTVPASA